MLGAALLAAVGLAAHEGHTHKAMGTIGSVDKTRLEVKDTDGKMQSFALSDKTKVERGGSSAPATSLKAGERVIVEYEEVGTTRTATTIRVGVPGTDGTTKAQAAYSCPMHPEVVSYKPGQCPKCGTNLVPKEKTK